MSTMQQMPQPVDAIALIQKEIAAAENERRAISRQMLADLVHTEAKVPLNEAVSLVDQYCDDNAPGVPYYLQEEFAIPYLKVVAVANVLLGIAAYWWAFTSFQKGKPPTVWLCVGTIFVGLGALAWVKSVERFVERRSKKRA